MLGISSPALYQKWVRSNIRVAHPGPYAPLASDGMPQFPCLQCPGPQWLLFMGERTDTKKPQIPQFPPEMAVRNGSKKTKRCPLPILLI